MPEIQLAKSRNFLVPIDEDGRNALNKIEQGEIINVKWSRIRNIRFHRLHFACLKFAFDHWMTPDIDVSTGLQPIRDFDGFRKEVMIMAGFRRVVWNLDGTFRMEPMSISFANMDEDQFRQVHERIVTTLLNTVFKDWLTSGFDAEEMEKLALEFVGRYA